MMKAQMGRVLSCAMVSAVGSEIGLLLEEAGWNQAWRDRCG